MTTEQAVESKSTHTRRRILDAAASLLARRGYAGTRLSDVAEIAGIRAPAIYYYFDSREDLVEEVVTTGMVRNLEHVRAALADLPAESSALDRICRAVEAHLQVVLRTSDYTIAAVRSTSQLPPDLRERQIREQQRYAEIWRELIDAGRVAGEIHPGLDPRAARMLILGALNWACEWWSPGRGSLRSVVFTAQALVRRGLAPPATVDQRPA
ncbi:TetR/AcrR family transcriptional regulator [Pseudonocardia halophobica]|uniref:TetR family transcriptional regulator n=1 Tax=Pseudonocardia halophobica TaxID=29401 RepID=A0A9W6L045_9PSEU|nr:TetR/AcrR family transcriptional regulator [Pseudonocardia halophobica]GLL09829.1 TetR family transcriptional regulator [Pseudonocardia halophobica]